MDGAAIPPSSDFARSIEDWDSPTVPSHANEQKQARHNTANGGQAQPSAHPMMGSTDIWHCLQWVDTKDGGGGVFTKGDESLPHASSCFHIPPGKPKHLHRGLKSAF